MSVINFIFPVILYFLCHIRGNNGMQQQRDELLRVLFPFPVPPLNCGKLRSPTSTVAFYSDYLHITCGT